MQGKDVTIVTPFAGIPPDDVGKKKYTILHDEHVEAVAKLGVKYCYNGPFLDDVYPGLDKEQLRDWLESSLMTFDLVLVPLGIHHPDHIATREACDQLDIPKMYYSDLPYATDYTDEHARLISKLKEYSLKEEAVREYVSQIGGDVVERCMQKERLWTNERNLAVT